MIEKFISPGDKVEMKSIVNVVLPDGTEGVKTYKTSVHDIQDEGLIEIVMPMEKTKLVLLPIDGEYEVCFFSHGGMYRATVRIVDRQKVNGIYILIVEMTSNLHKYQRREYYRFNCIIDMLAREMSPFEIDSFQRRRTYIISDENMVKGIIVDISGGGARFVSRCKFEEESFIIMQFELPVSDENKSFLLAAKVIYSNEIPNREKEYENRIKFEYIDNAVREEIIKYIFDEERKNRKNERGR